MQNAPSAARAMLPEGTFRDQVAVITGGGTGLGRAMALELARLGARVVIASRNEAHLQPTLQELRDMGAEALAVTLDVRDYARVEAVMQEVHQTYGRLDILINNAAGNFLCPAEKLSANGWKAVVDIVLNGSFYCARAAAPFMIEQRRGNILSMLASYAWTGGPGTVHSAAAKAGVMAMTRTLAVEWGGYGIRVNAISPGAVPTPGSAAALRLDANDEAVARLLSDIPVGHVGEASDIANAAAYLLSDYASFINGEVLVVDGGQWLGKGYIAYQKD